MPDGQYTRAGWGPLPFCEREESAVKGPRRHLMLLWGSVCLGVALLGMLLPGLWRKKQVKA